MAKKQDEFQNNVALMAIVIAVLVVLFTAFHYIILRSRLVRPGTYRIFDWSAAWSNLFASAVGLTIWFAIAVGLIAVTKPPEWQTILLWVLAIASIVVLNWAGKTQALAFIGVVVDRQRGELLFPPTIAHLSLEQRLLVVPIIMRLTTPQVISLADIEGINRQAGRRLFLHVRSGSVDINFSNKLKRDECIHAIRSATRMTPARELEADYDYQES